MNSMCGRYQIAQSIFNNLKQIIDSRNSAGILLTMLLPYLPSEKKMPIPKGFDGTVYPEGQETVPKRLAIVRANRHMVDHADVLIAYVWHTASNTRNLLDYAKKKDERGMVKIIKIDHQ